MPSSCPIFISYAHEDADAARAIADSLRAFGLEVWFDQNELRGGDQWDSKIRSQIKACGLFVPVISRTTQIRDEAYFRLEWKLADDRSHLMAPGKAFIVPVVIDDTPEYEATVPESFAKAQWSRLPGGEPSTAFVEQVKRLASPGAQTANPIATDSRPPRPAVTPAPQAAPPKRGLPVWALVVMVVVIAAACVAIFGGDGSDYITPNLAADSAPPTAQDAAEPDKAPGADRRSIAVLPFVNMSDDPSASSFFADGIHEDLLTNLSFIGDLRVVSRTSVMQYRNTAKPVRQIAEELRVGTLLEGSVRRAGDRVRVTAQLIDASNDEHLWAQTYDRELKDIFAIQGELAKAIAAALKIALTDQQEESLAQAPTDNPAAYELYLRERELTDRDGNTENRVQKSIELIQHALALDPTFAQAWSYLAVLHAQSHFWNYDRTEERLELAKNAIEKALDLAPTDLEVLINAGSYHYYAHRDYTRAAHYYQQVLDVAPNNVDAIASMGFIRRREGKWAESITHLEKARSLDPRNVSVLRALAGSYEMMRHFDRAIVAQEQLVQMFPENLRDRGALAQLKCKLTESFEPLRESLAPYESITTDVPASLWFGRMNLANKTGDWDRCTALLAAPPDVMEPEELLRQRAFIQLNRGNAEEARRLGEKLIALLEPKIATEPDNIRLRSDLLAAYAVSGDEAKAKEQQAWLETTLQALNDAVDGQVWRTTRIYLAAFFGTPAEAAARVREALPYPGTRFSRWDFLGADFPDRIRESPEFQALLADDAAWAPIPLE